MKKELHHRITSYQDNKKVQSTKTKRTSLQNVPPLLQELDNKYYPKSTYEVMRDGTNDDNDPSTYCSRTDNDHHQQQQHQQQRTADFIRDVELSAKKILRDDHSSKYKIQTQKHSSKKTSSSSSSSSATTTTKNTNPTAVAATMSHKELLHHKLKGSPFYEAWEEWNKSKNMKKQAILDNGSSGSSSNYHYNGNDDNNYDDDNGMFVNGASNKHNSIKAYIGQGHSRTKQLSHSQNRFDMKEHLTIKSLRKRFRCDQDLELEDERNYKMAPSAAAVVVGKESREQQLKDKEENGHNGEDEGGRGDTLSQQHPLEEYLFRHVNTIRSRMKVMTQKRIESMPHIKDIQSCWDINKVGLRQGGSMKKGMSEGGDDEEGAKDEERSSELQGDNCQLQSVPLHKATQAYVNFDCTKKEGEDSDVATCTDSLTTSPLNNEIYSEMHINEHGIDNYEESSIKIIPECWPFLIEEDLFDGELKVSIHLMRSRKNNEDESSTTTTSTRDDHQYEYWVIDFYNKQFQKLNTFMLLEDELEEFIRRINLSERSLSPKIECQKIVHIQEIRKNVGGFKFDGKYSVTIRFNEHRDIVASIQIKFHDIESQYGTTRNMPIESTYPVYEIVARLDLFHICKACDLKFWTAEQNGKIIWERLFGIVHVDLVSSEVWEIIFVACESYNTIPLLTNKLYLSFRVIKGSKRMSLVRLGLWNGEEVMTRTLLGGFNHLL